MSSRPVGVHLDFLGANQIKNVLFDVVSSDPSVPVEGQFWYNSSTHLVKYRDNGATQTFGTSSGVANAYSSVTDGGTPQAASGADTLTVAASGSGLSVDTSTSKTVTYTLASATSGNNKVLLTGGGGKIAASTIQEVIALADLTDVSATTGGGSTVVFNSSPTIVTPTIASFANANHDHTNSAGGGTLTHSAVADFDAQVRTSRLDQMATPTANVSLNSNKLTNVTDPTGAQDAATKAYVDAVKTGLDIKDSVRVATTAALPANTRSGNVLTSTIPLSLNTSGIDGVTNLTANDRVLVKDESTGANNGIYTVTVVGDVGTAWQLTRAADADASAEVTPGMFTFVEEGSTQADEGWVLTTNAPITLNTTALAFVQFSGAGEITAGAGLTKTGNTIDVATAATARIVVNADNIDLGQPTIGGSGAASGISLVTVDVYGRVTNTSEIITSNGIPARTAAGTFSARTITGTASRITVTNGDGVAGNPTIDINASYVGQSTITTVGTIGTGTWQGTAVGLAYGGTGVDSSSNGDSARNATHLGKQSTAPATATNVAVTAAGIPTMAKFTITGTGSATSFTLTHNMNTSQPIVQIYDDGGDQVTVAVHVVDANSVTVAVNAAIGNTVVWLATVLG